MKENENEINGLKEKIEIHNKEINNLKEKLNEINGLKEKIEIKNKEINNLKENEKNKFEFENLFDKEKSMILKDDEKSMIFSEIEKKMKKKIKKIKKLYQATIDGGEL